MLKFFDKDRIILDIYERNGKMSFNVLKYVSDTNYRFMINSSLGLSNKMDDIDYIKRMYNIKVGHSLNLENPKSFTEKIQWLKIYDHNPLYSVMVDKVLAKDYVGEKIGFNHIIPTYGVWESGSQIIFDSLPDQFVLKSNHNSKGVIICRDKSNLDFGFVRKRLDKEIKRNGYFFGREWPYKNVVPRILAEKLLENEGQKDLIDYKFYCFSGKPLYCQVIRDRSIDETIDFYDMEWIHQKFIGLNRKAHNANTRIDCPESFEKMKWAAELLSNSLPFVRVDFYDVFGEMYFGEITLYPASGFGTFKPDKWDYILGDLIQIPGLK